MENKWSRHGRNSVTPVKQRRSGYEPSDAETEISDSPWHGGKMRINVGLEYEGTKAELDLSRNISPLKQSTRHSSRIEYDGPSLRANSVVSPVRRRNSSKSPYKPRRDDGNARNSPLAGSDLLRNISPLSKSERRRHVSPFQAERGEHDLYGFDDEIVGSNRKQQHHRRNSREEKKPNYSRRSTTAPRHRSPREVDQQNSYESQTPTKGERSRTPTKVQRTPSPLSKNMAQKQRPVNSQMKSPSVGEINEMLANAKLARTSPNPMSNNKTPVFGSSDSISPGDIFFSRECTVMALPRKVLTKNGDFESPYSPKRKMVPQRDFAASQHRSRTNGSYDLNGNGKGTPSPYGLSQMTTTTSSSAVSRQSSGTLSVGSGKRSDASGTTTASMRKFTANRRKSESQAWFSCMRKGACKTNKSPERGTFNEAAFIEKAFVVESLRQFWADKHQPASLNGFTCHKQEAQILKQLVIDNISPHILFTGPSGSGKKALTMAYLRETYGDSSWEEQKPIQVVVPLTSSAHHVELNVQLEANARYALMGLVREINNENAIAPEVSSVNFKANHKVMVLYGVDKAAEHIQHLIKWIMDCYSEACKLILCCENDAAVIESVKNRCKVIKVDAPVTHEIMEVLIQIARKEDFDLPMSFANKIAIKSKQNLRKAIMGLEACKAHNYPFGDDQPIPLGWEEVLLELAAEILADPSPKRLFFIRGKFQKLLVDFVHPKLILLKLVEQFLMGLHGSSKRELYYWHAYYEKRLPAGASALLKLEEFMAKFMSIYRKSSNNRQNA
ncbi:PREDICTED: uncharacterized protein LOC103340277 [Prunus mume]|uniref:Uncharacterized protein LOC103340277 n=1 Tax=Prunus mume TaxID=102107 RepID=A0ABM0PMW7_PRUMU|nr:PREDICTED: uncharacterized protein LOC103340277 [Prunus mume]